MPDNIPVKVAPAPKLIVGVPVRTMGTFRVIADCIFMLDDAPASMMVPLVEKLGADARFS